MSSRGLPDMDWVSRRLEAHARSVRTRTTSIVARVDPSPLRRWVTLIIPLAGAIALTVIVLSGATTARGRIAASTDTHSLFGAGSINLVVDTGAEAAVHQLPFDETGLYGGQVLQRCLLVSYEGSFDTAALRLHGRDDGGTGLGRYLDVTIETGSGTDYECGDFIREEVAYEGSLDVLLSDHSTFDSGLRIDDRAVPGRTKMVRVRIEVIDDNDAQDLITRFHLVFEVRP